MRAGVGAEGAAINGGFGAVCGCLLTERKRRKRPYRRTLARSSIGGALQRMELALDGSVMTVGFAHDDRNYLSGTAYTVTRGALLVPCPSSSEWDVRSKKSGPVSVQDFRMRSGPLPSTLIPRRS